MGKKLQISVGLKNKRKFESNTKSENFQMITEDHMINCHNE